MAILGLILAGGLARRMGGGDKPLLTLGGRTLLDRAVARLAPQCPAGLALSANGDPARFAGFPGPTLPDTIPDHPGPLAGILAGLDHAAERNAASATDSLPHPHPEVRGTASPRRRAPEIAAASEGLLRSRFAAPQDESVVGRGAITGPVERVLSVSGDAPFLPFDLLTRLSASLGPGDIRIALAASAGRQHYTVALWPVALRHDLRDALVERGERRVGTFIARAGFVVVEWLAAPVDPFFNVNGPEDLAAAQAALAQAGG